MTLAPTVLPLAGRERELAAAERVLDAAIAGSRTLAVRLAGEPGIGKTRLLSELSARAEARGATVLEGRASEYEGDLPFGVAADALDAYAGTLDGAARRVLGEERLAALGAVLGTLGSAPPARGVLQEERHRTYAAVRALLEVIASERPLLLVLDDVHWSDPASIELLAHLLRRRPRAAVVLALAFRSGEAPPELRRALEGFGAADLELDVGPLDADAAATLLGGVRAERRGDVLAASGGNPLYLLELVRSGEDPESGAGSTPEAIRRALAREVRRASTVAALVAKAAAVAGAPFSPELAAAGADVDEQEALRALDELVAADLVRPGDAPREFRFRHPLVRQAIYEEAEPAWRLGAHERVAAALERQGAAPARRAVHLERCIRPGDEQAISVLAAAGHAASAVAPGTAARWFEAALGALPHDAEPGRRMGLLVPIATAQGAVGRLAESRDALRRLLDDLTGDLAALRTPVIGFIAMAEHQLGRHAEAEDLLTSSLDALPVAAASDAAGLCHELAASGFYAGDFGAMEQWARAGLDREAGDPALVVALRAQLALARYSLGDMDDARAAYAAAAAYADALADDALAARPFALLWLSWFAQSADLQAEGIAHAERGLRIARATGQGFTMVPLTIGRAIGLTWSGRLADAAAAAEEAVEMAHLAANDQYLTWTATLRCWIHGVAGEVEEAVRWGERAVAYAAGTHDNLFTTLALCYRGEALLLAGDAEGARAEILRAGDALDPVEPPFRPRFYEVLARAELALGDRDAARGWAERAWADASGPQIPSRLGEALRARGAVALADGDAMTAAALAREAAAVAGTADLRVEEARGRLLAGRALVAAGDAEEAVTELKAAAGACAACGATRLRDEAAHELRALGRRAPATGRKVAGGPGGLSERQLEIARLVAAGHTNREIAAELFLSERTVETHLATAFRKLGVKSRAAVAAAITQAGPLAS